MGWPGECPDYRYENDGRAVSGGGVDQVGVAGPIHRCRRDDCAGAAERLDEAGGVADIAVNHLHAGAGQLPRPGRVAGQHSDRKALAG